MEALPLLILVALMWLLLIRPQQQRVRRQRDLVATLAVGDRVVTIGGIKGTIVGLDEEEARIEVAPGTVLTLVRPAVSRKAEAGETRGYEGDEG
ncbi:MAG TPA: preprotein translocase subunit YajC [Acidimicrobiales bacterium]|nr:preprotein translocase subunit YajC [Acidimicrobiales bacterium]